MDETSRTDVVEQLTHDKLKEEAVGTFDEMAAKGFKARMAIVMVVGEPVGESTEGDIAGSYLGGPLGECVDAAAELLVQTAFRAGMSMPGMISALSARMSMRLQGADDE